MRYGIQFLLLVGLLASGCAHVKSAREDGTNVSYVGTAQGAAQVLYATDGRPFDLANTAMEDGVATSLARDADGDVRFWASQPYVGYGAWVDGYAPGNVTFVPGQGFVFGPPAGGLPQLAPHTGASSLPQLEPYPVTDIVPCPKGREPLTAAEQAACAMTGVRILGKRSK